MRTNVCLVVFAIIFMGCSNKKVEITAEYIVNPNWNRRGEEVGANTIEVKKMRVKKDSMINPFTDLNQEEILNKLEYDSLFSYFANVKIKSKESYKDKKIYFNRENEFYWLTDNYGNTKTKVLGKLQTNNWYEISRLNYYYYVIYIDSLDKVHRFIVNQANW